MKASLPELRANYVSATFRFNAVNTALDNDKAEARGLYKEIEKLKLEGHLANQEVDDLLSINRRYLLRLPAKEVAQEDINRLAGMINDYYNEVIAGTEKLDWCLSLVDGLIWSGWYGRLQHGRIVLINKELCQAELLFLKQYGGWNYKPNLRKVSLDRITANLPPDFLQDKYWLSVQVNEYRDTCTGERDGMVIAKKLAPLLIPEPKPFTLDLEVLQ